ncbi:MAG: hypothetical protein ACTH6D_09455 [Vibrio litoralis]
MNNHVNNEQQAQEKPKPKNWKMIVWKGFTTVLRLLNILCSIINWIEGGSE